MMHATTRRRIARVAAGLVLAALALTACTPSTAPRPSTPAPMISPSTAPAAPTVLASGLAAPWSIVPIGTGALISQRDDARVLEWTPGGGLHEVGVVPDVVSGGEAGLNGLAVRDDAGTRWLYAYHATADDNRVVRVPLTGSPGALRFDRRAVEVVFRGIPRARFHDGGRIAFGPDGMLYVGTGDAEQRDRAGDRNDLGGKILRLTPEGRPAPGNPFGTAVYSLGHRNVEGLAWDGAGRLWASEFGQDTWDELNLIRPGGDYGWPEHEGKAGDPRTIDPVVQWRPADASPSGIAIVHDVVYLAALRGERLWAVDIGAADPTPRDAYVGEFGRLRDVVAAPNGTLWVLTNNTDGRGSPRQGDDRLLQLPVPRG
ncbi:PQQ-dependent sugar dehydrogenase [Microbacterium sp. ASV81]|uniref:PQQ-dependent sugar dehydrogenase n=1 Tax=Microbacterium capsulatum TaxID=3041921 RepID=A0ABU0XMD9_9MICO|nr:PQQ-dependent sugar dehydrogenase [Microbacterium sp. ASV81]MDQ4215763.1 PQQ-dependent sugar dehydrogenase [Microbacterium sp. ASV81]